MDWNVYLCVCDCVHGDIHKHANMTHCAEVAWKRQADKKIPVV
jgi:hypothetical protein